MKKTCPNCRNALSPDWFDTGAVYCRPCIKRNPQLVGARCRGCGAFRAVDKFPGGDRDALCVTCDPKSWVDSNGPLQALRKAKLVRGTPKTAPDLLSCIGYPRVDGKVVRVAHEWLAEMGYEVPSSGRRLFAVAVEGSAEDTALCPALAGTELVHGPAVTVRELLAAVGVHYATRKDVLDANQWLRQQGHSPVGAGPVMKFELQPCPPGHAPKLFRQWCETYPDAAAALAIEEREYATYLSGAPLPSYIRYAMSAAAAGLPMWSAALALPVTLSYS